MSYLSLKTILSSDKRRPGQLPLLKKASDFSACFLLPLALLHAVFLIVGIWNVRELKWCAAAPRGFTRRT